MVSPGHADRRRLSRRARAGVPDGDLAPSPARTARPWNRRGAARPVDRRVRRRRVQRRRKGCRRCPTRSRCCARARSSSPAATTSTAEIPEVARLELPVTEVGRLALRAGERPRRRCSSSCASAASKASASSGRPAAVAAAGALVRYLRDTQKADLAHVRTRARCKHVADAPAHRSDHAEAPRGRRGDGRRPPGLAARTRSIARSRRWAAGCCAPGCSARSWRSSAFAIASTRSRNSPSARPSAASCATRSRRVQDLERLVARIALGTAGPRDLVALRRVAGGGAARLRCCSATAGAARAQPASASSTT